MATTPDDPNISYRTYLNEYYKGMYPSFFNAGVGVLPLPSFSWGELFTEAGLVFSAPAPWACGLITAATGFMYVGVKGLYETITEDGPEAWYYFTTLVYNALDGSAQTELDDIGVAMSNNEVFTVSDSLRLALEEAVKGVFSENGPIYDAEGNLIDTSIVVPAEELRVGAESGASFNAASANRKWLQISYSSSVPGLFTGSNEWLKHDVYVGVASDSSDSWQRLTNLVTGASLTFNYKRAIPWENNMSRFYYIESETDGAKYWSFGTAYGGDSAHTNYCHKVGIDWVTFEGTGTVLDGRKLIPGGYDATTQMWKYNDLLNDWSTWFPLDSLGTILSNTGNPDAGVDLPPYVGSPALNPDFPASDTKFKVSGVGTTFPTVGADGIADSGTVTQPMENVKIDELVKTETDAATDNPTVNKPSVPLSPDFLGGIGDDFLGLFDWLPVDFTDSLDEVINALSLILVAVVAIKLVDIIWP